MSEIDVLAGMLRIETLEKELATAQAEATRLRDCLEFYADPETYHGVMFMCDPPGGGWAEDFSDDHGHSHYDRPMPGKAARQALAQPKGDE